MRKEAKAGKKVARIILFRVFNHRYLCRRNLASVRFTRTEQQLGRLPPGQGPLLAIPLPPPSDYHRRGDDRSSRASVGASPTESHQAFACAGLSSDGACSRSVVFPLDEPNGKGGKRQRLEKKALESFSSEYSTIAICVDANLASVRLPGRSNNWAGYHQGRGHCSRSHCRLRPISSDGRRSIESCFRWSKSKRRATTVCLSGVKSDGACSRSVVFPLG